MGIKWFLNTLRTSQSHRSQCGRFYSQDKESKLGKHANITKKGYSCTDLLLLLSRFGRVQLCATHRRQPSRLPRPWDSPGKNTGVGCHFLLQCKKVKNESEAGQSCPTLSDPMDCSLPGSSIHGIFQARVLDWVAIAFSVLT